MTPAFEQTRKSLRMLPRALAVVLFVAGPVLAVPSLQAADSTIIEAPTMKKMGAGFVLMVSLRRG